MDLFTYVKCLRFVLLVIQFNFDRYEFVIEVFADRYILIKIVVCVFSFVGLLESPFSTLTLIEAQD